MHGHTHNHTYSTYIQHNHTYIHICTLYTCAHDTWLFFKKVQFHIIHLCMLYVCSLFHHMYKLVKKNICYNKNFFKRNRYTFFVCFTTPISLKSLQIYQGRFKDWWVLHTCEHGVSTYNIYDTDGKIMFFYAITHKIQLQLRAEMR